MNGVIDALAGCALVTLAVLVIRVPVARTFGARAAYALWIAPLLRLVVPLAGLPAPRLPAMDSGGSFGLVAVTFEGVGRAAASPPGWLLAVWLAGAALYLAARLLSHYRFLSRALAEGRPLRRDYPFDLVATPAIDGPLATGLIHRLVLVPEDFEQRFTPGQQRLALAHEALHHRRGDLWACSAALVVTALNWFNPLAHVALGAFRRDMEAACDAQLMARSGAAEAAIYAETLLRCAARPVPRSLCALTSIDELKGRLTMLTNTPNLARRIAGLGLAALVAGAGLSLSLPATAQSPEAAEPTVRQVKVIELKGKPGDKLTAVDRETIEKMVADRKCPDGGEPVLANAESLAGGNNKKAVIMLCAKGGGGPGGDGAIEGVEKALKRIQADTELDPAMKAELVAQLSRQLAELKAR